MSRRLLILPLFLTSLTGFLASCAGGEDSNGGKPTECGAPVAVAGADVSASLGGAVTLDGSGSTDCDQNDSTALSYGWTLVSAPVDSALTTSSLSIGEDASKASFTPDVVGTYVASLEVTDFNGVASQPDIIIITVSSANSKPIADCGGNQTGAANARTDFDGSGSSDPDGSSLSWSWVLASSPDCSALDSSSIYNGATSVASVVPDCAGIYVISLAVSDGTQWSDPAYCTLTVGSGNQAPIADAGDSETIAACEGHTVSLDGFGSYDPEGAGLTYQWSVVSVPTGSGAGNSDFNDSTSASPNFTWDVAGAYTFQLQVYDGTQYSAPDIVTLTFQDEENNEAPQANAGEDVSIENTAECETASYVFSCEDCAAESVSLSATASYDADGDELDFEWSDESGELTLSAETGAVTTVTTPSFPSTYNTTTTYSWEVGLTVRDCSDEDTDKVTITYSCTGEYSP